MPCEPLDPATRKRILGLLAAENIDSSYLAFVLQHAEMPDATWRWCCGSHCDPCVQSLGRVVDGARQLLPQTGK